MEIQLSSCAYERVVIYSNRAEVRRVVTVNLVGGETELILCNMPPAIESDSIRVEGRRSASLEKKIPSPIINDVIYINSYEIKKDIDAIEEEQALEASTIIRNEIKSLEHEKKVLEIKVRVAERQKKALEDLTGFFDSKNDQPFLMPIQQTLDHSNLPVRANRCQWKNRKANIKTEVAKVQVSKPSSSGGDSSLPEDSGLNLETATAEETLSALVNFLDFHSMTLGKIEESLTLHNDQLKRLVTRLETLKLNLSKLVTRKKPKATSNKFCKAVKILIESTQPISGFEILLSYLCTDASWCPSYQLSFSTEHKELELQYSGIVTQGTGEDWINCPLSLSTASPTVKGRPPILTAMNLSVWGAEHLHLQRASSITGLFGGMQEAYTQQSQMNANNFMNNNFMNTNSDNNNNNDDFQMFEQQQQQLQMFNVEQPQLTNTEGLFTHSFDTTRPATIPADNTEHKVTVAIIHLTPEFEYITSPEISSYCYLLAKVTNSTGFPLLAGVCSVFLDGNFISKTRLQNVSPQEQFSLSLGVDSLVRIFYIPGHRTKKRQAALFGKGKNALLEFIRLVEIRNTKDHSIKLLVRQTLPLSQDERVKVTLQEPPCKKQNTIVKMNPAVSVQLDAKNIIEWTLNMEASTCQKLSFAYQIEHPYELNLPGLK